MRNVVWLVLLFVVAVVAATTLGSNDGLVTVYWAGWRTELSLNLFLLLLIGSCVVLFLAAQTLSSLLTLPQRAGEWRALRRERAAQAALREALAEYFGARYTRAHKAAEKALALQHDAPALQGDAQFGVLARLLAAGSMHRLQDGKRRDALMQALFRIAQQQGGHSAEEGARLLAAEWALDDRDADRAAELLNQLPAGVGRRTQALRLRLQASRLGRKPLEALHTARLLAKHQAFTKLAARSLLRSLAGEAIDETHDLQQLRRLWQQLEPADRDDAWVAARAAQHAVVLGANAEAREWLRPFWDRLGELDRDERDQVALALLEAAPGIEHEWLPRLDAALGAFGHESAVTVAVGMAFADRQLWGKARKLLEQSAAALSLSLRARRRAWRALAQMAREESDEARAQECERAAAALE